MGISVFYLVDFHAATAPKKKIEWTNMLKIPGSFLKKRGILFFEVLKK
jgi:hypothetical protein